VVAGVSYLDQPLFGALQFHEIIASVEGLGRIDVLTAGAVADVPTTIPRLQAISAARASGHLGARAVGATFHSRQQALLISGYDWLDISFIRYNSRHTGARADLLPYLPPVRSGLIYNFKSTMFNVSQVHLKHLGWSGYGWVPEVTDHYRFVLSHPGINGLLCSPMTPQEVEGLARALEKGSLTAEEGDYMIRLTKAIYG
jgi:hypothetical protein